MADEFNTSRSFDLREVYSRAFGHVGLPYPAGGINIKNPVSTVIKTVKGAFNFKSTLGAEYLFPIKIGTYQLPNEALVSISGSVNIIETALNRGDRVENVLEEINLNNYQVRIRGVIINEDDPYEFPEDDLIKFREMLEAPGSKSIECELLRIFNINQIAIRRMNFPAVAGMFAGQFYDIDALSDQDFELEVINDENQ